QVRVELGMDRPLYVYLLWVNTAGKVAPVYPWRNWHWDERPAEERRVTRLGLPDKAPDVGYEMDEGITGMETGVLLARPTPLPHDVDLASLLLGLPTQTGQQPDSAAWFENGEVARDRGPRQFDPAVIDDPLLRTQHVLKEKLQPHAAYMRAVSFAFRGR